MSLKELNLKKSYDSDKDDILREFYVPALSHSVAYKRLAGFFSSSSLAIAARGISNFIANEGHMRLITSARLTKADIDAIRQAHENPEKIIERMMLNDLNQLEDKFVRDHVCALGWMIANKKLEIKIAIVINESGIPVDEKIIEKRGIFHQKVGILEDDEGNRISFSGSDNETAAAWQDNIEEFKVFHNWIDSEKEYFEADYRRFEKFWGGSSRRTKIIDVPEAIKKKLIKIAPKDIRKLDLNKYTERETLRKKRVIKLRDYQKTAIKNWLNNNKKGIFEMATGTGKTFAALGCLKELMDKEKKIVVVIAAPYIHLISQWKKEVDKFGISHDRKIIADSSNLKWKREFINSVYDIKNNYLQNFIILTTHATFSLEPFIDIVKQIDTGVFLIADEVHGVGTAQRISGLVDNYHFRLGLSATPKRWFDEEGSKIIFDYFGDVVFEYPLSKAIEKGYLVPYEYRPYFLELTEEELEDYRRKTEKVAKAYYATREEPDKRELFSKLCFDRQKIVTNAINKYDTLEDILSNLTNIDKCLIYCSPEQRVKVQEILLDRGIKSHKFTYYEDKKERELLLRNFEEGKLQVLVAIKCLDEGLDVPPTKIAIILASSGNPRQFIQRRGRVLRPCPGKDKAIIFDFIVLPSFLRLENVPLMKLEKRIFRKELLRYREFSYSALNKLEALSKINNIETQLKMEEG